MLQHFQPLLPAPPSAGTFIERLDTPPIVPLGCVGLEVAPRTSRSHPRAPPRRNSLAAPSPRSHPARDGRRPLGSPDFQGLDLSSRLAGSTPDLPRGSALRAAEKARAESGPSGIGFDGFMLPIYPSPDTA